MPAAWGVFTKWWNRPPSGSIRRPAGLRPHEGFIQPVSFTRAGRPTVSGGTPETTPPFYFFRRHHALAVRSPPRTPSSCPAFGSGTVAMVRLQFTSVLW